MTRKTVKTLATAAFVSTLGLAALSPAGARGAPHPQAAGRRSGQPRTQAAGVKYVPHQILVTFRRGVSAASRASYVASSGDRMGTPLKAVPDTRVVNLAAGKSVAQAVRDYRNNPNVVRAQPNYIYHALSASTAKTPDDPQFDRQWALHNTGQTYSGITGTPGDDIDAPAAWRHRTDCANITTAVIDAGVNYTHADLAGNMWDGNAIHGKDFVDNDQDTMPTGGNSHGTHVAGIIAAVGNNGNAISGVCWKARIMSVRVLGPGGDGKTSWVADGIKWAVDHGARILNMSLGGETDDDTILRDEVEYAAKNGVLVVAGAGNDGVNTNPGNGSAFYPCALDLDNVICVAALTPDYRLADFSNYGDKAVDVGAPGQDILSTFPGPLIHADFSRWNKTPAWKAWKPGTCEADVASWMLTNPGDWCNGGYYADNLDATAYRTFDLSAPDVLGAGYQFTYTFAVHPGDYFKVAHKAGANPGTPFNNGELDAEIDGAEGHLGPEKGIFDCVGKQCSIGFNLQTSGSYPAHGVGIQNFALQEVTRDADTTELLSGTSMATPYVTGVAALAWSIVPDKGYKAIRSAVLKGGDEVPALDGKTVTGRAVDALKAMRAADDPPSITLDPSYVTTTAGQPATIAIHASDPDKGLPQKLSYHIYLKPSHGTVKLAADHKSATYTPDPGFVGEDNFGIQVTDGYTGVDGVTALVKVTRSGGNSGGSSGSGGGGSLGWPFLLLGAALAAVSLRRRRLSHGRDSSTVARDA